MGAKAIKLGSWDKHPASYCESMDYKAFEGTSASFSFLRETQSKSHRNEHCHTLGNFSNDDTDDNEDVITQ